MPANSQAYTLPPPIGGWNAKDALDLMPESDAIRLVNIIPEVGNAQLRPGFRVQSTGMGTAVQSLFEYADQSNTRSLIACANGKIWNATTQGVPATQLGTGFTVNYWQGINFQGHLILVNGTDQPQQYVPAGLSDAVYTGVTDNDLIHVTVFKSRLYFVEKNSCHIWYGATNAVTGALTQFDVTGITHKGGYIQWCGTWSRDKGNNSIDDLFVIATQLGELLIYSGSDPTSWALIGHFFMPIPLGRRSLVNLEATLAVLTEQGLLPLSDVLQDNDSGITDKIKNAFRSASALYKSNTGWDAIYYPTQNLLIINIPIATNSSSEQYVMNTLTGGWCRFTGMNSFCWSLTSENIYFGGASGVVYQAMYGTNDNNAAIPFEWKSAFNYLGDRAHLKQLLMAKPIIMGDTASQFSIGADVDFSDTPLVATTTTVGASAASWDTASWDTSSWDSSATDVTHWGAISGLGRNMAFRLAGNFKDAPFSLSAVQLIYKTGGAL